MLARGSRITVTSGTADNPHAGYSFTVGERRNPMAPARITFIRRNSNAAFVNTGVHFLNGYDYLYDAASGHVGFRWTGHVHEPMARVSTPDRTEGRR
jgi:hypothetical protein